MNVVRQDRVKPEHVRTGARPQKPQNKQLLITA